VPTASFAAGTKRRLGLPRPAPLPACLNATDDFALAVCWPTALDSLILRNGAARQLLGSERTVPSRMPLIFDLPAIGYPSICDSYRTIFPDPCGLAPSGSNAWSVNVLELRKADRKIKAGARLVSGGVRWKMKGQGG
jgi:hypothetical protein